MSEQTQLKYHYTVDLNADNSAAYVVRMVGNHKRVLDIGAGPGSIARTLRNDFGCRVTAVELNAEAVDMLQPHCERVYRVDLNEKSWDRSLRDEELFDVVVAADVLEHLLDPWSMLKTLRGMIGEDGYMVVSLPHSGHSAFVATLMDENFEYRDWGLLDRTHLRFFGMKGIEELFEQADLDIVEARFVVRPPEKTELVEHWHRLPPSVRRALSRNRFSQVYQVVMKAVPRERASQGISLRSMPVANEAQIIVRIPEALSKLANALFSAQTRSRLRRLAARLGL